MGYELNRKISKRLHYNDYMRLQLVKAVQRGYRLRINFLTFEIEAALFLPRTQSRAQSE